MTPKFQFKRGASGTIPTASDGEPLFTTDTKSLYIGYSGVNYLIGPGIVSVSDTATVDLSLVSDTLSADVKDNSITNGKLRDSAALSVIGNATNATADPGDIAAGGDHQVLRRSGTTLAFGALNLAQSAAVTGVLDETNGGTGQSTLTQGDVLYASGANTLAKLGIGSAGQVLTVSGGVPAWDDATAEYTDEMAQDAVGGILTDSSRINFTYTDAVPSIGADIIANSIGDTHIRQGAATSVIGRSAGTTGNVADIAASADGQVLRRSSGTLAFGAVDLADTDAVTGVLDETNGGTGQSSLTQGDVLYASGANTLAKLGIGSAGTVLTVSGGVPAWVAPGESAVDAVGAALTDSSTIDLAYDDGANTITADVKADSITDAMLRDSAALSVIGNATNATADPGDIAAGSDHQVLRRSGTALAFGAVNLAQSAAVTGVLDEVNGGTGQSTITRGDLLFGSAANTLAKLGVGSSGQVLTVLADGVPEWSFATVYSDEYAQDAVGNILVDSDRIDFTYDDVTPSITADIVTNSIGDTQLRQGAATSVIGRSAGTLGDVADIAASADGQVLRRSGGSLAFGAVDLADTDAVTGVLDETNGGTGQSSLTQGDVLYASASNTFSKLGIGSAGTVLTVSGGVPAWVDPTEAIQDAVGAALTDTFSIDLTYSDVTNAITADVKANGITDTFLRDSAALSVIGNATNASADPADIAAAADHTVLRRNGTSLGFGAVNIAQSAAVTGTLAVDNGGTGQSSYTTGDVLYASAANTIAKLAIGTSGKVLTSNGTTPAWSDPYGDEQAQDAVGGILVDSSRIDFTYTDATPSITADVKTNSIGDTHIRQGTALSVIGRSANSTGNVADIAAGSDHQVLRRSGTTLAFGALNLAQSAAVTGVLDETNGGTGQSSLTTGDVLYASASNTFSKLGIGASGKVLQVVSGVPAWSSLANPGLCEGRLTLTTAVPVTTSDVTGAGTLYFTPYKGNRVSLYDGTNWQEYSFTERSLSLSVTSDTNYDVYLYDNAGTLTLEAVAWTNDTTRATALATQDGVYVKTGATGRKYLGTIRASGANTTEDSVSNRFVWNYFNRVRRYLLRQDGTDSWTYATSTWRAANNNASNSVKYVQGVSEDSISASILTRILSVGDFGSVGIGIDATATNSATAWMDVGNNNAAGVVMALSANYNGFTAAGFHTIYWLEYRRTGTMTFYGDAGGNIATGLEATLFG